jgi:hypothetical protein
METLASIIITIVGVLLRWQSQSLKTFYTLVEGFLIGIFIAAVFYGGTRLTFHYPLRRHILAPVTLGTFSLSPPLQFLIFFCAAYMLLGRVGPLLAFVYVFCQFLGGLIGGLAVSGWLENFSAAANSTQSTVPLPLGQTLATVMTVEMVSTIIVLCFWLFNEFATTGDNKEADQKDVQLGQVNPAEVKAYNRATKYTAIAIAFVIVVS